MSLPFSANDLGPTMDGIAETGCYEEQGVKQAHNLKCFFSFQSVFMQLSQALTASHSATSLLMGGAELAGAECTCGGEQRCGFLFAISTMGSANMNSTNNLCFW